MAIADSFRDMPDFKAKEKPPLSIDLTGIRRDINRVLREKITEYNAGMLHPELDKILPGTSSST